MAETVTIEGMQWFKLLHSVSVTQCFKLCYIIAERFVQTIFVLFLAKFETDKIVKIAKRWMKKQQKNTQHQQSYLGWDV